MIVVALIVLSLTGPAVPVPGQQVAHAHPLGKFEQLSQAADRARDENRDADAIQLYKQGLELRPDWREGLWYLSTLLYEKERYGDARDALRRFLTQDANAGPGWALLGMSEFQTREYPRALDHLQRAMALGLGGRQEMAQSVFYFAAVLLTRFERYDDSMDMLLKMLGSGQDTAALVEPAGLAALRIPLLPAEIRADRHALVRLAGQAVITLQTQRFEDAEAIFKQLESAYPSEPGVHFLHGAYLMKSHPEDGISEMKRELEISPSHVLARVRIAEQYIEQQQFDEAMPLAEEAVKLDPKRASTHMVLGEADVGKGNLAAGIKQLETARDDDPLTVRVHWDLFRAYSATGRTEDAKREKEEIEKLSSPQRGQ
jgi:tetratricopeptide (TPR) repeat protein